ncbi:MAG: multicopper oxidase domain-containing protein [Nitrospirae bacterium]|nr:multicopper oxidase domain-containing protein [Nitrospirota bacterium]
MRATLKKRVLFLGLPAAAALAGLVFAGRAEAATINKTVCVRNVTKTLSGTNVNFWGFTEGCMGMGAGLVPGPVVEMGEGDTLNLTLNVMMAPEEAAPYNGHTIHLHGLDVPQAEDGVPETGASVSGDTYTFTAKPGWAGSYIYHCHVHTVKHLEMGMYASLIIRPKDANGNFLKQITSTAATAYDYVQNYLISTVDPGYHTATGDSTVFADYNPLYFLIEGKEGKSKTAPAVTLAAATGKKVALRLIGLHSVNARFTLRDSNGSAKSFTIHTRDGRSLPAPETVSSVSISPGQRYDILFTLPSTSGTWYPQVEFQDLWNGNTYTGGTVYGKITF